MRRQPHPARRVKWLVIRGDLLDVHRRRQLVIVKVMRIDDAHAVQSHEAYPSVLRFSRLRRISAEAEAGTHTIRNIEHSRFYGSPGIGNPGIQFGPLNSHQAARHIKPSRVIVIFNAPENGVTG